MEEALCSLCRSPVETENKELCKQCLEMEQHINRLIWNHTQTIRKYLAKKFNETADEEMLKHDRRKKEYTPPLGKHTPSRRKRIRRTEHSVSVLKRRKIDD